MTKYPNITITFTINPDDVTLKAQATCEDMSKGEIIMALDMLKRKVETDEFPTIEGGSYYSEESFPLHEPSVEITKEQIVASITQRIKDEQRKHSHSIEEWHEIAARKIYSSFDIKSLSEKPSSIIIQHKNMCDCTQEQQLPFEGFCGNCGNPINNKTNG